MYGPKGIGGIIGKRGRLDFLDPVLTGGGAIYSIEDKINYLEIPMRLESGTRDVAAAVGWEQACRWLGDVGFEKIIAHEREIYRRITSEFVKMQNLLRLIKPGSSDTSSIVSFISDHVHAHDIDEYLSEENVIIRTGHMCAHLYLQSIGEHCINRISIGTY